jgi:anti-sigma factor RsiW
MSVDGCEDIRGLLVDFVDGELGEGEPRRVSLHVDACDRCARRVDALGRSLAFAERVWEADLSTRSPSTGTPVRGRSIVWHRLLAGERAGRKPVPQTFEWRARRRIVAAAMVGLAVLSWAQFRSVDSPEATPVVTVVAKPVSIEDVEAIIWKAGAAARMLASADMLAEAPGGQHLAAARLRVVLSEYADTPSAPLARGRLTLLEGTSQ